MFLHYQSAQVLCYGEALYLSQQVDDPDHFDTNQALQGITVSEAGQSGLVSMHLHPASWSPRAMSRPGAPNQGLASRKASRCALIGTAAFSVWCNPAKPSLGTCQTSILHIYLQPNLRRGPRCLVIGTSTQGLGASALVEAYLCCGYRWTADQGFLFQE